MFGMEPSMIFAERAAPELATAGLPSLARPRGVRRAWRAVWPRLLALTAVVLLWQTLVWLQWRPSYVLPGPLPVAGRLVRDVRNGALPEATATTLQRALIGFTIAIVIGSLIGLALARARVLRTAFGSLVSGLQAMPSVAWFPLAIL